MEGIMRNNVLNIAKKEFIDLLSSKFVLIVTAIYLLLFLIDIYQINIGYHAVGLVSQFGDGPNKNNLLASMQGGLWYFLTMFGSIIALIIGYLSITSERQANALNTLITKPVYRDSVINGKLLGDVGFLLFFFFVMSLIYTSGIILVIGGAIGPIFKSYILSIPVSILLSLFCVLIFYSYALLATILIKRQTVSLFTCAIAWLLLTEVIPTTDFGWYIGALFGESVNAVWDMVSMICPTYILLPVFRSNGGDLIHTLFSFNGSILLLVIYFIIILIVSYITFLRSDIA